MTEISQDHLEHLIAPYGLMIEKMEFLQLSQNYVYRYRDHGRNLIVRISRGRHRKHSQTEAELSWILHLIKNGIRACAPVPTIDENLCFWSAIDEDLCIISCFEHAPGSQFMRQHADCFDFERIGMLVGQMHNASKTYREKSRCLCSQWENSRLLKEDFDEYRQFVSDVFQTSVNHLIDDIRECPKNSESFGIIHGDVHFGNLHDNNGELWVFDFDNCEYAYFIQDLAVVLYDCVYAKALNRFADDGLTRRMKPFWQAVVKGYIKTRPSLSQTDMMYLRKLFLLREAILYVHYHGRYNISQENESFVKGIWIMKENVETQSHQVDFEDLFELSNPSVHDAIQ